MSMLNQDTARGIIAAIGPANDVFTYLDLLCERNGIDLGMAAARKFNEVGERVGFPDRIDLAA